MREKEYKIFVDEHKTLLKREAEEEIRYKECVKRLSSIRKSIKKNNDWLLKQ